MAVAATPANPLLGSIERSSETGTENTPILQIILENINTICDGMPKKSKFRHLMTMLYTELRTLFSEHTDQAGFDLIFLQHLNDLLNSKKETYTVNLTSINTVATTMSQSGASFVLKLQTLRGLLYDDRLEHAALGCCGLRVVRKVTQSVSGALLLGADTLAGYDIGKRTQDTQANISAGFAEFLPLVIAAVSAILYVRQTRDIYRLQNSLDMRDGTPLRNGSRLWRANFLLWLLTVGFATAFGVPFYLFNTGDTRPFLAGIGMGGLIGTSTFFPMAMAALYLSCYARNPLSDAYLDVAMKLLEQRMSAGDRETGTTPLLTASDLEMQTPPSAIRRRPSTAGGTRLFLGTPAGGGGAAAAAAATL